MKDVYILDAVRTPIGSFGGSLSGITAVKMGEIVISCLLERNKIQPEEIDEVLMGNVLQAGLGQNITRQCLINAGIPVEKTGTTINMVCGSGLRTVTMASQAITCGDAEVVIAGGTENMSASPYLLQKGRTGYRMGNGEIVDEMIIDGLWDSFNDYHMGMTAENLAEKYGITRIEQDEFAASSQNRAEKARKEGRFDLEITPVTIPVRKGEPLLFSRDEYIREGVTLDSLSKMRPAFRKDGSVTAGNASGINDGAAALILAGGESVRRLGIKPMARVVSYAYHGTDPSTMGIGPVEAVRLALNKAGWTIDDLELIESNEAFAVQALSVNRELGWNPEIINVNGGAIALGHPIGASGARILTTLLFEMERRHVDKGLATLCIGGGMGIAVCVESVSG